MLSQRSEPASAPSSTDMSSATVSPADLQQPVAADFPDLEGFIRNLAQEVQAGTDSFEPNDFLTSPWTPSLDTFGDSPGETPLSEFLSTPLITDDNDDMFTGPNDLPLFTDSTYIDMSLTESSKAPSFDTSGLLTMSPTSPNLGTPALDPSSLFSPAQSMHSAFPPRQHSPASADGSTSVPSSSANSAARRRTTATGTRKNVTVDSLVPLDAPTQTRRYVTPSATSRKELPAVFARKRARNQMLDGEEDELEEPLKPNATELEQIEWKRRQNTLAARKSRQRKLRHQQDLETQVSALTAEREKWRQRALTLQGVLQANGIPFAEFQD
ncbi:hypothetical protein P691DRAFT_272372 [Macrolepiota fuliginosa MF-IS2]|uniref:BZIP domain-containing protein n=1 Tax=Macrolepiota fuliginosa MF-IS2 TaxID=1400762 RepID=A0A9P5X813_9AGAR|nr:hypothetical protein P691DRAFT_272372 [Macrolepiota fuliginosa MF-IS2]